MNIEYDGYCAYGDGVDIGDCPYNKNQQPREYSQWCRGWQAGDLYDFENQDEQ
jgi:hypothetical protein